MEEIVIGFTALVILFFMWLIFWMIYEVIKHSYIEQVLMFLASCMGLILICYVLGKIVKVVMQLC